MLTRDRDDLQLLNSLKAARSPHVPARIQVLENLKRNDEREEGKEAKDGREGNENEE